MTPKALTGLVLAGGRGQRMRRGGQSRACLSGTGLVQSAQTDAAKSEHDKGLLRLHGQPLVEHARRRLAPHVSEVLISANTCLDAYAEYGVVISDDQVLGEYSGPLAGVASALKHARTPWVVVLPVDVPHLPADLIERLCGAAIDGGAQIAYARTAGGAHPLCMVLHRDLMRNLYGFLLAGGRKVQCWQGQNKAVAVQFEGADFFNINTPQDLLRARLA